MKFFSVFFMIILFAAVTPGILVTLPKKNTNILYIAITHGILFACLWFLYCIIHKKYFIHNTGTFFEGLTGIEKREQRMINSIKKVIDDRIDIKRPIRREPPKRRRK